MADVSQILMRFGRDMELQYRVDNARTRQSNASKMSSKIINSLTDQLLYVNYVGENSPI